MFRKLSCNTTGIDFAESRRKTMAIHEHQRWNSFMISRGMIPASREQILSETKTNSNGEVEFTNGKNYSLRRHGNLTTFDGLVEFRRIVAHRDQKPEEKKDVIKYDYQLLDGSLPRADIRLFARNKHYCQNGRKQTKNTENQAFSVFFIEMNSHY